MLRFCSHNLAIINIQKSAAVWCRSNIPDPTIQSRKEYAFNDFQQNMIFSAFQMNIFCPICNKNMGLSYRASRSSEQQLQSFLELRTAVTELPGAKNSSYRASPEFRTAVIELPRAGGFPGVQNSSYSNSLQYFDHEI